jgi:hypothetical protein
MSDGSLRSSFYVAIACFLAIAATVVGWSQSLNYKTTPLVPLALWFPLVVIAGVKQFGAVALSLAQFPLFALAFALGIRRWPVSRVLAALVVFYVLLAGIAFIIVKSR